VPTRIELDDIFSTTWALLKTQIFLAIAVVFCGFIINVVVSTVSQVIIAAAGEDGVWVMIPLQLGANIISLFIGIGQMLIFLDIARGEPASFNKLLSGGPYMVKVFLTMLVVVLIVSVGFILLIVPGIILSLMFSQCYLLCIDRKMGVGESLTTTQQITAGNKWTLFLIWILSIGLLLLSLLPCFLGLIIFAPYFTLLWVVVKLYGKTSIDAAARERRRYLLGW